MDYKGFKKVKEDAKSTTLRHPKGHTIQIAHSGLSREHRDGLKKLPLHAAEGVDVPTDSDSVNRAKDLLYSDVQPSGVTKDITATGEDAPATKQEAKEETKLSLDDAARLMAMRDKFTAQAQAMPQAQPQAPAQTATPTPMDPSSPAQADQAAPPAPAPAAAPIKPLPNPDVTPATVSSDAQARANQEQMAGNMSPDEAYRAKMQEYAQQDQAWSRDLINGHITPKTYADLFHEKSVLGKIGMGIGMLLSGAGSGLAHQPNYALDSINKELERDYQAQIQSKANAYNFVRTSQEHQYQLAQIDRMRHENKLTDVQAQAAKNKADIDAYALSRTRMNQVAFHQMVRLWQAMPEGPQKQAAQQRVMAASTMMNAENANIFDAAAAKSAFFDMGNQPAGSEQAFQRQNQAMRMVGMDKIAEARESHHFPGLAGQASKDLDANDREHLTSGMQFDQQLHRFMNWTAGHSGDLSPSDRHEGEAMAADLQGAYRQATHGGVYKEGEQNFISKLIDSEPTKFFNSIRVMPQLRALARENEARVDTKAKSLGFQGYKSPSQQAKLTLPPDGTRGMLNGRPVIIRGGKPYLE